jgi:hypothetical protein
VYHIFEEDLLVKRRFNTNILILLFLPMLITISVSAQATRTWVSGVGDDVNPCSRTAPCKTWQGAISKTLAGGEIDALDPGGFGAVTITKGITIDGGGGIIGSTLSSGVNGFVVNAGANETVILRNLRINGAGTTLGLNGVRFIGGKSLIVENCDIYYYSQNGIDISLNQSTAASVLVKNTVIVNTGQNAIRATNANASAPVSVVIDQVTVHLGANGIVAADNSKVRVSRTVSSNNTGDGFRAVFTTGPTELDIDNSEAANNGGNGVAAQGASATVRITSNKIVGNAVGISATGGQVISFGNNSIGGNTTNGAPTSTVLRQ